MRPLPMASGCVASAGATACVGSRAHPGGGHISAAQPLPVSGPPVQKEMGYLVLRWPEDSETSSFRSPQDSAQEEAGAGGTALGDSYIGEQWLCCNSDET